MKPLSITVPLHADEILTSYCSRTAAANGLPNVRAFTGDMSLDFTELANGEPSAVKRLAELVGLIPDQMKHAVVVSDDMQVHVGGQTFSHYHFHRRRLRFCPHCVMEDETRRGRRRGRAYGRMNWTISFIRTCPVHRSRLITSIRADAIAVQDFVVRLGWERPCMSEHLLASSRQEQTKLELYVIDRLHGKESGMRLLDSMPLYAAAQTAEWVGATMTQGYHFKPDSLSETDWQEAATNGFDVLAAEEAGVRRFVEDLCAKYTTNPGFRRGGNVLGRFYSLLKWQRDTAYDPIRKIVHTVAADRLPVGPGDDVFGPITERKWHTVVTAAKLHRQTPGSVATKFRAAGLLPHNGTPYGDRRVIVDARKADELLATARSAMSSAAASRMLNVTTVQLFSIMRQGLLTPIMATKDTGKAGVVPFFVPEQVMQLRSKMESLVVLREPTPEMGPISGICPTVKCTLKDFIPMLFGGKLKNVAYDCSKRGYRALLVDPVEVRRVLLATGQDAELIPVSRAYKRMPVTGACVLALVRHGYLRTTTPIRRTRLPDARYISPDDIVEFRSTHMTLTELTNAIGIRLKWIERRLYALGVGPSFDPDLIGAVFYRRSDVEPLYDELRKGPKRYRKCANGER